METNAQVSLLKNKIVIISLTFFVILSIWWTTIHTRQLQSGSENNAFTLIYPLMALAGTITGFINARKWGGMKSYLGKAITFLSLGLLFQFLGQAIYTYFIYIKKIDVPYPSIGDIGYFGSVIFYIIGSVYIGKVVGLKNNFSQVKGQIIAFIIPIILLLLSYFMFLGSYTFEPGNILKVFLDFGYPIGEALYVSIALICLTLSKGVLNGIMKKPLLFLVFTLIIQYIADFTFLYQAHTGSWYVGGINDYLYFISYFCMTIALVYFGTVFDRIKNS